jgi:hypothetical protein
MRFVENHQLIVATGGRVTHHLTQFANLVDTAVGRSVNFNHIEGIS